MSTIVTRSGKGTPLTNTEVDANFTNLNTDKLELSGGTLTGNLSLGDNVKLQLGNQTNGDLQLYHTGTESIIADTGTGHLFVRGQNLLLQNADGSKAYFSGIGDVASLYYGTSEKLATTSTGIDVTGTVETDELTVSVGGVAQLGNIVRIGNNSAYADLTLNSADNSFGTINFADASDSNVGRIQYNHVDNTMILRAADATRVLVSSTGIDVTGSVVADGLTVSNGTNTTAIPATSDRVSFTANSSYIQSTGSFYVQPTGDLVLNGTGSEIMRLKSSKVGINNSNPATALDVTGTITADGLTVDTGNTGNGINYGFDIRNSASGSGTSYAMPAISWSNGGLRWASVHGERNSAGGYGGLLKFHTMNSSGNATERLKIASNGDISFYDSAGSSQNLFWDSSTSRLGLGTSAPSVLLDLGSSAGQKVLMWSSGNIKYGMAVETSEYQIFAEDQAVLNLGHMARSNGSTFTPRLTINADGSSVFSGAVTSTGLTVNGNLATVGVGGSSAQLTEIRLDATSNSGYGGFIRGRKGGSSQWLFGDTASALGSGTGLINYVYGDNPTSFYNNGQLALNINGSQNVNIPNGGLMVGATTAPQAKINVYTDAGRDFRVDHGTANRTILSTDRGMIVKSGGGYSLDLDTGSTSGSIRFLDNGVAHSVFDSSGNLGVGGGTISSKLFVNTDTVGDSYFKGGADNSRQLDFSTFATASPNAGHKINATSINGVITLATGSTERFRLNADGSCRWTPDGTNHDMTLTSGGLLLIGTTSTTPAFGTSSGVNISPTGESMISGGNNTTLFLNRTSGDGSILDFRKDGTTAGLVGVKSDTSNPYIVIGKGSVGLQFASDTDAVSVLPARADNLSLTNGAMDIGSSTQRFRDLYLSGGVYLGGTGAANKLDDYEFGTFTAVLGDGTNTINMPSATYTKIGRYVTISVNLYNTDLSSLSTSGSLRITNLPFTTAATGPVAFATNNPTEKPIAVHPQGTFTYLWITSASAVDYTFATKATMGLGTGNASVRGTFHYQTT